jgi:serine/threonine protein kinase
MAGERWDRVRRLFEAALEKTPLERAAYLEGLAASDPDLRDEVASLLASHRSDTAFEVAPAPGITLHRTGALRSFAEKLAPSRVGPYRNLREIGEGGMGIVFEALQEAPVRRTVALKLIKWGMDTKEVIARFESERQALALMNHPNIASVYDAGATEEGRPYFAMEFVPGVPVTEYCDRERLNIRERLDLFVQVCEGVQHAHQKGVIHRDIKPTNVLVVVQDGKPVPKLIDFGVAKATSYRLTERTLQTVSGQLVGTPEYMSPEQAELANLDVDTRTDVYSLGVLLYELLVGALPFEPASLARGGFAEIQRRLREDEPPRPSTRFGGLGAGAPVAAARRRSEIKALHRQLRSDLDWIAMKALEKERGRRYASPSELAADIGRYLSDEPVLASPPSGVYRFRKFVRRHRMAVASVALLLLTLTLGVVGTTIGLIEARQAQRRALDEAAKATAVHEFLRDALGSADPFEGSGRDVTVVEMLDDAARRIGDSFADAPEIDAAIRNTVGLTYLNLGRHKDAEPLLQAALARRRRSSRGDSLDLAESLNAVARLHHAKGEYEEARTAAEEGLSMRRRLLGDRHPAVAESLHYLSEIVKDSGDYARAEALARESLSIRREAFAAGPQLRVAESLLGLSAALASQGELEEAETTHRESLEILKQIFGRDHLQVAVSLSSLGQLLNSKGDNRAAESALREALPILRRELPAEHEEVALGVTHLATVLQDKGEYREAEELFREALAIRKRLYGTEHPRIAESVNNIGVLFLTRNELEAAEPFLLEALAMNRRLYGEEHPNISDNLNNLAVVYRGRGDYRKAEDMFQAVLEMDRKQLGEGHPYVHATINNLAGLYARMGDYARAEAEHRRALEMQERALPAGHWQIANTRSLLGAVLTKAQRFAEAEPLLLESYPILEAHFGKTHDRTSAARERIVALYEAWGKAPLASSYRR